MNTPTKEYGYDTAITPEEIKGFGKPQEGDEVFFQHSNEWIQLNRLPGSFGVKSSIRRPIDPSEGWEIVPGDECETSDMEYFEGGHWKPQTKYFNPHTKCNSHPTVSAFRRRKSEPAMEEGWELVPKEEVKANTNKSKPGWQFKSIDGHWINSTHVDPGFTYRRPKSKPEQYGWLKPDCGIQLPYGDHFMVKLEDGRQGNVYRQDNIPFKWSSSNMPIESPIAFWHRTEPAPEVVNIPHRETAWLKHLKARGQCVNSGATEFFAGWDACEAHHAKGAK